MWFESDELDPLNAHDNPVLAQRLAISFMSDMLGLDDRPHEIRVTVLPFDQIPRRWSVSPISDEETTVLGGMHRVIATSRDQMDERDLFVEIGNMKPTEQNTVPVWNDLSAVSAICEMVEQTFKSAQAGAILWYANEIGWDIDGFIADTSDLSNESRVLALETMTMCAAMYVMANDENAPVREREMAASSYPVCRMLLDDMTVRARQGGVS